MRRKGFEPPTYWFVASYSIQLSYRRIFNLYIIPRLSDNVKPFSLCICDGIIFCLLGADRRTAAAKTVYPPPLTLLKNPEQHKSRLHCVVVCDGQADRRCGQVSLGWKKLPRIFWVLTSFIKAWLSTSLTAFITFLDWAAETTE